MRKSTPKLYISAAVITLVIFTMGVLAGLVIEGERMEHVRREGDLQKINFDSIQLQYLYLSSLESNKSCPVLASTLNDYIKENDEIRLKIEQYSTDSQIKTEEFNLLKRKYVISQINYWYLAKRTKQMCGEDYIIVLFFYDKDEAASRRQGFILDYYKKMFGDRILIFALDTDFTQEPLIKMLMETYDVSYEPTIVVEEKVYPGFTDSSNLKKLFCSIYREKPSDCL